MSLIDELRAGIRRREVQERALGGRVLVFGPGDDNGKRKRRNLVRRLNRRGFQAFTSEQLSRRVPSDLNPVQQEEEQWVLFDIVLVLDFSEGPALELARYGQNSEFRRRAFVIYPEEYDPIRSSSFGAQILRDFPSKERSSWDEWQKCVVSKRCLDHALARRRLEAH